MSTTSFKECREFNERSNHRESCEECPRLSECVHDEAIENSEDDVEDDTDEIMEAELKAERSFEEWFHKGTGY